MATKEWRLKGEFTTRSSDNLKQNTYYTPVDILTEYTEHALASGVLPADAGVGWEAVSLGPIATAKMVKLTVSAAVNVRLNGTSIISNVTELILVGDATQLELQRHATLTRDYTVHFFE